jgi:signal transduction histidine kinase
VVDVIDNELRKPAHIATSFSNTGRLNSLARRSAHTEKILKQLSPDSARVWVVDSQYNVQAIRGSLTPSINDDSAVSNGQLGQLFSTWLSKWISGDSTTLLQDYDEATSFERKDSFSLAALAGEAKTGLRQPLISGGQVIAASYPIRAGDRVIGAVIVEQSADYVLARQQQAIIELLVASSAGILFVIIVLIGFASRLAWRIRRLGLAAGASIDDHGRLLELQPIEGAKAGDEIGELARHFNQLLGKLQQHQQFLASVPRSLRHEINNPLNTLYTSLEQLEQIPDSSGPDLAAADYLARARRALGKIRLLTDKLAEAANLEQALAAEQREIIDFTLLVQTYCSYRQRDCADICVSDSTPDSGIKLRGSDIHLEQLLDKLLDNAIDFHIPGTPIEIEISRQGQGCRLSVSNQGPTIEQSKQQEIFGLLSHRQREKTSESHIGLGLFVARIISEQHGGDIAVQNLKQPPGVEFTVDFKQSHTN